MMRGKFLDGLPTSTSPHPEPGLETLDSVNANETAGDTNSIDNIISRKPVFDDLEAAENMVVQLLDIVASTVDHLSSLATNTDVDQVDSHKQQYYHHHHHPQQQQHNVGTHRHLDDKLKKNGKEYLDTIKRINSLLLPHAHMIKAYEIEEFKDVNNTQTTNPSMYISKIELHLAREKQKLLSEFLSLENDERMADSEHQFTDVDSNTIANNIHESILGKRKNAN